MFFLELYKFFRSRTWVILVLSVLISLFIVIGGDSDNAQRFSYNPLLQGENISWVYFVRNFNFFFLLFLPLFLIVIFASSIYLDKEAKLLRAFTVTHISKIKFWVVKYLFLQLLTLVYILAYLGLPVLFYILFVDPVSIDVVFFKTLIFLSIKSWISLLYTTTIIFLLYLYIPKLFPGIILALGVYLWIVILPGSSIALFVKSVNSFSELSLNQQPFLWKPEHFMWEIISLKLTSILMVLFVIIAFFLRRTARFQRLFFGLALITLMTVSCNQDAKENEQIANMSMAEKDSSLVQWLDTMQVMDNEGKAFVFSDLLESTSAKVIYLDFWNSHCIPCMKAFPGLNELSHQYAVEELKIIYLNSDDEFGRWEKALSFTGNLSLSDHYQILNPDFKIMARVGLNVYPRYMVINSQREIIEFRAPTPYKEYVDSLLMGNHRGY